MNGDRALPAGTVTFLFTDIEGSTRIAQSLPSDVWLSVLATHHRLVAGTIAAHDGVVFATGGDSFAAAFERASAGVNAAAAAQVAVARHAWPEGADIRVRMGLHTGPVDIGGGDYVGVTVHEAARVAAAAHGGQIIVSESTRVASTAEDLAPHIEFASLGRHRLKDLASPMELHQVVHPDLAAGFAPPRSLDRVRHNLPPSTTTFIGRRREINEVGALLTDTRLITITGPGGAGKTRLALEVAAGAIDTYRDGIWWAALDELPSGAGADAVWRVVASALALRDEPGRSPAETVLARVEQRSLMVVVDNCEHVVDGAAEVVAALLGSATAPASRVLATSREALRLPGERVWRIPPLGTDGHDAERLFVERAVAAGASIPTDSATTSAIRDICQAVDGLPLGVELAAAWAPTLEPGDIASQLRGSLDVLERGSRGVPTRQATMRNAIDWSYSRLTSEEQRMLRHLSAFVGTFPRRAVEVVASPDESGQTTGSAATLAGLVDKSLVAVGDGAAGRLFRLLLPIRAFARERLTAHGEDDAADALHLRWVDELLLAARPAPGSFDEAAWFDRIADSHPDVLAALARARGRDPGRAVRWTSTLVDFWDRRGHWRTGVTEIERALGLGVDTPAHVDHLELRLHSLRRRIDGTPIAPETLHAIGARAEARGEAEVAVNALRNLAIVDPGGDAGQRHLSRALDVARTAGDRQLEGSVLLEFGTRAYLAGEHRRAKQHYADALEVAGAAGDHRTEGLALGNLGSIALDEGELDTAAKLLGDALSRARAVGEPHVEAAWTANLAELRARQGDRGAAALLYESAVARARSINDERLARSILEAMERDL